MAIYPTITRAEYDALPGINWSALKAGIGKTAAHVATARAGRPDKPAYKFGRAFHHAVLQPELLAGWEIVDGKTTTKPNAVTASEIESIRAMATAALALHGGKITHQECGLTWTAYGRECKALIDGMWGGWLLDLKSTQNADPAAFRGEIFKFKYHGQCAWYLDGLAANSITAAGACLLAVEKAAPYAAGMYALTDAWIDLGRTLCAEAIAVLDDDRHDYGYQDLDVPDWAQPGITENDEGGIDA